MSGGSRPSDDFSGPSGKAEVTVLRKSTLSTMIVPAQPCKSLIVARTDVPDDAKA